MIIPKNDTLWLLGEEGLNMDVINSMKVVDPTLAIIESLPLKFVETKIKGKLVWEIEGIISKKYKHFMYTLVQPATGGQSFVDLLVFEGNKNSLPDLSSQPIHAIEVTKNNGKESGNMTAQRAAKFVSVKEKWSNVPCTYLVCHSGTVQKIQKSWSQTHHCDFATMEVIGVDIYHAQAGKFGIEKHEFKFTYDTVRDMKRQESKKRRAGRGVPSRVKKINGNLTIQANLFKKGGHHDPNEGYVASRAYAIRQLDPEVEIYISKHKQDKKYFNVNKNNKFINILKLVGASTKVKKEMIHIPRETGIFDKPYWKYFEAGEKISSIAMEQKYLKLGWKTVFTNHAGCGKSDVCINGKTFAPSGAGMPDLVMEKDGVLLVIEAETAEHYKQGLKQVREQNFSGCSGWTEKNILKNALSKFLKVTYALCTFGKFEHRAGVIFNIDENFDFHHSPGEYVTV